MSEENSTIAIKECRDRRLARAMIAHLLYRPPGSNPSPPGISFSNHEDTCEQMDEICEEAGWVPKNLTTQQRALRAVALRLWRINLLERGRLTNGERESRWEATWQYNYAIRRKHLKLLSPKEWSHIPYTPEDWSTPEFELNFILDRAYPAKEVQP